MERKTGRYERCSVAGETVSAFVPHPLPPANPPLRLDARVQAQIDEACQELARLDLAGKMIPSVDWFIYAFVRKEAVLSSQIEGTQASLVDLLTFEAGVEQETSSADVEEVCNYLEALRFARENLRRPGGLPISMRLLGETHRLLMQGVRGAKKQPGEVRRTQNWIGGTRPGNAIFVPPPPQWLPEGLSAMERYIHGQDKLPALARIGLLHVQFETLHPYLDGNGRIGRLLITLLLEHWDLLSQPLLYLSLYFKRHQREYYRLLNSVRTEGDWEGWLAYFFEGVATIAREAVATAQGLVELIDADRSRLLSTSAATLYGLRLFEQLPKHPIVTAAGAMKLLDTTRPTAGKALSALEKAGILVETTGRKRDRTYRYKKYLDRLAEGTEP